MITPVAIGVQCGSYARLVGYSLQREIRRKIARGGKANGLHDRLCEGLEASMGWVARRMARNNGTAAFVVNALKDDAFRSLYFVLRQPDSHFAALIKRLSWPPR